MNTKRQQSRNIAILIFDDVEVLDFCGAFEVFSVANRDEEPDEFNVYTVAQSETIVTRGGLKVSRHYSLVDCPTPDVLLIPGGVGTRALLNDDAILKWITQQAAMSQLTTSVCTGALLLGRCGLLNGVKATTHHRCVDELRVIAPEAQVQTDQRFVDTGKVITSGGISAGIDMSLHIVSRLVGRSHAMDVASRMEYIVPPDRMRIVCKSTAP